MRMWGYEATWLGEVCPVLIDRSKAIELAEQAYQQEQERQAKFRAFMCARLQLAPGTIREDVEALVRADDVREISDEGLRARLYFKWGLPPDTILSEAQENFVIESRLADAGIKKAE